MTITFAVLAAVVLTAAGVFSLRAVWSDIARPRWLVAAGWVLLAVAAVAWAMIWQGDKAVAMATLIPSLVAFLVIATGADLRRPKRARRTAVDLDPVAAHGRQRWLRTALAGPVSLLAATGPALAMALHGPGSDGDRLMTAALLLPLLWAAFGAWALADNRLMRVFGISIAAALLGGAGAFL